ncbi:MAG TPA: efflux RND transporter periplasmic adaptor subunit [Xanthomonadales bacterium]|nr:efflux RND transporter periplasmic adaptor subunit [Xanthomonadales bacterium]
MRKLVRLILPAAVILGSVAVVVGLLAIAKSKNSEKKAEAASAILVETVKADLQSLNLFVMSQGTVLPRTETALVAEVPGKIVSVSPNFVAGGFFHTDEVLLQIDPSDYEAGVKQAQANLASRQAQYSDQKARSEQALKDWTNLGREGEPSDLALHKPQLAEALAGVQAAEADLQKAQRNLVRTSIGLPYDGLVRTKLVGIGQYVGPGTPLGVTFSIDTAEIRLPLSSSDTAYLQLPSATGLEGPARPKVHLSAEGSGFDGQWEAEIIRTEGVIDETSRVIYAVAQVIDPYGVLGQSDKPELKIGTFVRARIEGLRADNVVVLPRSVLHANDTVLVANSERKLEIRQVDVLRAEPQTVYISSGIEEGELVITTALDAPIPGTLLTVSADAAGKQQPVASQPQVASDQP